MSRVIVMLAQEDESHDICGTATYTNVYFEVHLSMSDVADFWHKQQSRDYVLAYS